LRKIKHFGDISEPIMLALISWLTPPSLSASQGRRVQFFMGEARCLLVDTIKNEKLTIDCQLSRIQTLYSSLRLSCEFSLSLKARTIEIAAP